MATIFLSHRGADTAEAEKLGTALKAHGHTIRFDEWDLVVGDSILGWMNDALGSSDCVLVCYSKHGAGPYFNREWQAALDARLSGSSVLLIPVWLTGRDGPFLLRGIKAADWMTDPDKATDDIVRAISKRCGP